MKTVIKILFVCAIGLLAYFCIQSIMTPINFEKAKDLREIVVKQRLIDIRTAEIEFKDQNGRFTDNFDSLIIFLQTAKKKLVLKEGSLTDYQLEQGLTETKAVKIVRSGNEKDIIANGLQHFRRDTTYLDMLPSIFPDGRYTAANIGDIAKVPFAADENTRFMLKVNNDYTNVSGIKIPLFEASAEYKIYLDGLNNQELLNIIDLAKKLEKFDGLKVGSTDEPNNNAGNWE